MKRTLLLPCVFISLISGCSPFANHEKRAAPLSTFTSKYSEDNRLFIRNSNVYQLLLGEFAVQNGVFPLALELYSALARKNPNATVLKKIIHLSLLTRKHVEAYVAAKLLYQVENSNIDTASIFGAMTIKLDLFNPDFFESSGIKKVALAEPKSFLESFLNCLDLVDVSTTGYSVALEALTTLENFEQLSVETSELFAILSIRARNYEVAMHHITFLAERDRLNLPLIRALISEATSQLPDKNLLAWIQRLRKAHSGNKQLASWEAILLSRKGDFRAARLLLRDIYISSPNDDQVAFSLALLELSTERFSDAKKIFETLLESNYDSGSVNFHMGKISEVEKKFDYATKYYSDVPSDDSQNYVPSQLRLAFILAKENKLLDSLALLSDLSESFPSQVSRISLMEGYILSEKGQYLEALEVYNGALKKIDYDPDLLYARSLVAEKLGQLDILENDLGRILEMEPNNAEVLNALGYSLTNLTDRHEEAYALIEKALSLMPESFHILDSMGWVCFRLGRIDDSIRYLTRAYSIEQDPEIVAHLIEALWADEQRNRARDLWTKATKEFPSDQRIRSLKHQLGL